MTKKSCWHTQQILNINVSSCSSFKMQSVISDMFFTEQRSPISESEGGNDWFLRAKKFSKFPLHYWHEMNNFENNVPLFLALFNWLSFFDLYIFFLSFSLSFFLSFYLFFFLSFFIYLFLWVHLFIYLFICLFVCLFVCLFIYLFIYFFYLFFIYCWLITIRNN